MRLRKIISLFFLLAVCIAAAGQETEQCRDFRFRVATEPVFFVSNPAAVALFRGHISMAEVAFRKDNGAYRALDESPDSYKAGAVTESYIGISDRVSFHGKLSWSYFAGQQMGGPVFMDPLFNPVSFLESTESSAGLKNRETYSLLGAVSYRFSDRWAAGFSLDYVSADQNKVKDPRFSNILMDMDIKAGVSFRPSDKLMLGLSLLYRSSIEQLRGGIYGTSDKQYFIYADKGGFFGTLVELTGDYNYISMSTLRPMKNDFFGLGLQVAGGSFSNELEVLYRQGYWGSRSSSTATFFEFSGIDASYRGRFVKKAGDGLHKVSLDLDYEFLRNYENLFNYVTPSGQDTRVEYFGQNPVLDRYRASAGLSYVWFKGLEGYLPRFSAGASLNAGAIARKTLLYPFYRNSDTETMDARLFADKSFFGGRSVFTLGLNGVFRTGFGTPRDDGSYDPAAASGYLSFDNYLDSQFEYDTANAAGAGAALTYTYLLSPRFVPYIRLSDDFSALLQAPQHLGGRFRNVALITLGCSF